MVCPEKIVNPYKQAVYKKMFASYQIWQIFKGREIEAHSEQHESHKVFAFRIIYRQTVGKWTNPFFGTLKLRYSVGAF